MAEALRFNDPERRLQFHTGAVTPGGRGDRPAAFHGHGVGQGVEAKTDILRDFHKVDEALQEVLRDEEAPLVLAGVDYLQDNGVADIDLMVLTHDHVDHYKGLEDVIEAVPVHEAWAGVWVSSSSWAQAFLDDLAAHAAVTDTVTAGDSFVWGEVSCYARIPVAS